MSDNRLGAAVSPYLRQHADNPVDWREWGEDAFAEARDRGVPVLVSIGYATCHWCHVMARESFSDPVVAERLRAGFVAVKVDREERPDVDASTMAAAGAFTEQLGWPLTAFMTPDAHVFYAGTYYPPTPVGQHPSFTQVLDAIEDAWRDRRDEVHANAAALQQAVAASAQDLTAPDPTATDPTAQDPTTGPGDGTARAEPRLPSVAAIRAVVPALLRAEDATHGGFGGAPKFPSAPLLEFLGDVAADGDRDAAALLDRTLSAIAGSELVDRDGGVFRYATRRDWTVPHYERMLYDNAGLLAVAGRTAPRTARGIASFLRDTLRTEAGTFVAAQDSESTIDGHRVEGEWYRRPDRDALAPPPLDDHVLTGWNGLAVRALAIAGAALADDGMLDLARTAAEVLLAEHVVDGHVTVRSVTPRGVSTAGPQLEDVGLLADGLLELALVTGDVAYAAAARTMVADGLEGRVGSDAVLATAGTDAGEQPQTAMRSGTVGLASAAATLGRLTGDAAYTAAATRLVAARATTGTRQPLGFADALSVALDLSQPSREVVVVTEDPADPMRAAARAARRPGTVVATVTPAQAREWAAAGFALFESRDGAAPAAYVCHDRVCALPVHSAPELAAQL